MLVMVNKNAVKLDYSDTFASDFTQNNTLKFPDFTLLLFIYG